MHVCNQRLQKVQKACAHAQAKFGKKCSTQCAFCKTTYAPGFATTKQSVQLQTQMRSLHIHLGKFVSDIEKVCTPNLHICKSNMQTCDIGGQHNCNYANHLSNKRCIGEQHQVFAQVQTMFCKCQNQACNVAKSCCMSATNKNLNNLRMCNTNFQKKDPT